MLPAEIPPGFRGRLLAAEPPPAKWLRWLRLPAIWTHGPNSWRLAYSGLAAAWVLICALRLATPPPPPAVAYAPAVQRPAGSSPVLPTIGGFSVDRSALLATNHSPTATTLQP